MLKITYDGPLDIATAKTRKATSWKNKSVKWSDLVAKLCVTHRTAETYADYLAAKPDRQDEIKDIGGFVGGYLTGGKRRNGAVAHRQLITLDIDHGSSDTWDNFCLVYGCAAAIYTTHKHSEAAPRYRLVIPLDREIFADEYEPICRRIAEGVGIEAFSDVTTYEPTRLMYWPSTSKDGVFTSDLQDGPWLSADEVLGSYRDWKDSSQWPVCSKEVAKVRHDIKRQEDPLEKTGIIGAFCRVYSITDAIETFLGSEYEGTADPTRYTYTQGSTAGGLVLYDDKFAYSHHGSDPCSGKLCNAFDLVRIHKYGLQDEDAAPGTTVTQLPSFKRMSEFAAGLKPVRALVTQERIDSARYDFSEEFEGDGEEPDADSMAWLEQMEVDKKTGKPLSTIGNIVLILEHDPRLAGRFALNDFEKREVVLKSLPWRKLTPDTRYLVDADDANLRNYIETFYKISVVNKVKDAIDIVIAKNTFNPVREYLEGLRWDGVRRLDTLLIDYLGAEDSEYTRTVTRKTFVAAVARVYTPGIKYDTMLTLVGAQGIGKSTLVARMGGMWFSDSFNFHMIGSKEANEQVQGAWLVEVGEMTGLRKADLEAGKSFISRQIDRYRVSYGKRLSYYPRQCIFIGSTNHDDFLRDPTGNRRFWPIRCGTLDPVKSVWEDLDTREVAQLWAEAIIRHETGEALHLNAEMELQAAKVQKEFTETDEREGLIRAFLNKRLPDNWDSMDIPERRSYLQGGDGLIDVKAGTVKRERVCAAEVWCELFNGWTKDMTNGNTKFIHAVLTGLEGWERMTGNTVFANYGRQRGYLRKTGKKYQ